MDDKKIQRINELAKLKKERGLSKAEAKEQQELYKIVLKNIRSQVTTQLEQAGHTKKPGCQCGCQDIKGSKINLSTSRKTIN